MSMTRIVVTVLWVSLMAVGAGGVSGQNYPSKPIRIVTGGAGAGADVVLRLLADELAGSLGQPVAVENRVSAVRGEIVAKAKPGELNYGSGGTGSGTHLGPELLKATAGVNIVRIQYSGAAEAVNGVLGGEVQMAFLSPTTVSPHVKSGKLRALAVTTAQPTALVPGLPTVAASSLPDFEVVSATAMWAPAGTPTTIINQLNRETVRILNRADMKTRMLGNGSEAVANSPAQAAATIKSEMAKWSKVIKDAGIRSE